jgi:transaldolase/glucose-6-phosphate isomerase
MVKIPATAEGRPGDRALHRRRPQHQRDPHLLARALRRGDGGYIGGLEKRAAAKKPVDRIASVASFFVSRVDTAVDKQLESKIKETGPDQQAQ